MRILSLLVCQKTLLGHYNDAHICSVSDLVLLDEESIEEIKAVCSLTAPNVKRLCHLKEWSIFILDSLAEDKFPTTVGQFKALFTEAGFIEFSTQSSTMSNPMTAQTPVKPSPIKSTTPTVKMPPISLTVRNPAHYNSTEMSSLPRATISQQKIKL